MVVNLLTTPILALSNWCEVKAEFIIIRCANTENKHKKSVMSRGEFVMSGYLTKSPPESKIKVAQWHRRWFLLMDSRLVYPLADRYVRLEYYQSEVEAKRLADPKGVINLRTCTEVKERDPIKGHKFSFDVCTVERIYHLACETEEERRVWLNTLNTLLFEEPQKQNCPGRRRSPPQERAEVIKRIRESSIKLQRPLSFTGSPTNTFEKNSPISSRPLPLLPTDRAVVRQSRPLPPTPLEEDQQLPGIHIHHTGPKKSPVPPHKKKKEPPPRPVPFHLSHSNASVPLPMARSTSQPNSQTINDHYEVGPGQMILMPQTNAQNRKSPSPRPRRKVPPSRSLDESVLFINTNGGGVHSEGQQPGGGEDEYSVLESITATGYDPNNDDYSHLGPSDERGSPPPPPPPVRHSSKQKSSSYENLSYIPSAPEGDYSHLKHS